MLHFYGLLIGLAVVVWWSLVEKNEPRTKTFIPWILGGAFIGARVYFVIAHWDYYQINLGKIFAVWEGGLSIWGALIVGLGLTWIFQKQYIASYVYPLPLAQALGRVANGVNGEFVNRVFGIPWWSMEAILDIVLFGILIITQVKFRVIIYIVGYCLIRLILEPYR